jgi:hypothetical protein
MRSLYKLSEQAIRILDKGEPQEIIELVKEAYAQVAKLNFYENKASDDGGVDGVFVYSFRDLIPLYDSGLDLHYIDFPSTYLALPHSFGIKQVSRMKGQNDPFAILPNGSTGLFAGLKSGVLGGVDTCYPENKRLYLPTSKDCPILLKLAIALDTIDVYEELNIPPNIASAIIDMVIAKYAPKPVVTPDNL